MTQNKTARSVLKKPGAAGVRSGRRQPAIGPFAIFVCSKVTIRPGLEALQFYPCKPTEAALLASERWLVGDDKDLVSD
jgi:hypothetical protein